MSQQQLLSCKNSAKILWLACCWICGLKISKYEYVQSCWIETWLNFLTYNFKKQEQCKRLSTNLPFIGKMTCHVTTEISKKCKNFVLTRKFTQDHAFFKERIRVSYDLNPSAWLHNFKNLRQIQLYFRSVCTCFSTWPFLKKLSQVTDNFWCWLSSVGKLEIRANSSALQQPKFPMSLSFSLPRPEGKGCKSL